jgi:hypothetical protein
LTEHIVSLWSYQQTVLCCVTRLTRWVPLADQELLTLPEHMNSTPVFSWVRVTRSFVLYVCFVDRCFSFCTFSFGHCVVCPSIYGLWLPNHNPYIEEGQTTQWPKDTKEVIRIRISSINKTENYDSVRLKASLKSV